MSDYYTASSDPADDTDAEPVVLRTEHAAIAAGFAKLAGYTGNGGKIVAINAGGTAQEAVATTGTGSVVLATSPSLVTPALGTPASGVATNLTGTASGLTAGTASAVAVGGITGLGTGVGTALAVNVGSAGAPVVNGGALGTPSGGTLDNCSYHSATLVSAPAFRPGFATTATAAGTTTLTAASAQIQEFTGTTTQTVVMPDTTTLTAGHPYDIINNSTGALTINSSGGNLILHLGRGERCTLKCILASGTTAASWAIMNWQSGGWISPTFSAGDFTAPAGNPTWTVASGDVGTYAYKMDGPTTMIVLLFLATTTVGGTPGNILTVAIPAGRTATKTTYNAINYFLDNNVVALGACHVVAGETVIRLQRTDAANFTASTNLTYISCQITFEVDP